jgi:GTP-binding protein EngB required for normal cell division
VLPLRQWPAGNHIPQVVSSGAPCFSSRLAVLTRLCGAMADKRGRTQSTDQMKYNTELLDVLSQVKSRVQDKLGIVDFPMPQFILIGSQSVGKSRLVEAFAGEQFNFCSGTLGSRRPTVLEFRNVMTALESKWFTSDNQCNWTQKPMAEVMQFVGESHSSLGTSVSKDPIYVRIESARCVDMQIVDLPGYRNFADGEDARKLKEAIEDLNRGFLMDPRNVILCVEQAGDAANCSSLAKVKDFDPSHKRTILIRNKLDKYYRDLNRDTVNEWLRGYDDLPKDLIKFALSLPHWQEGQPPPKHLADLRDEKAKEDEKTLAAMGASRMYLDRVGFANFTKYMEQRIEKMFQEALGPVLTKLKEQEAIQVTYKQDLAEWIEQSDTSTMLSTCRAAGMSFANCLTHVMEGYIRSDINRMTLDDELRDFHRYHESLGDTHTFEQRPSDDFQDIEDYIRYLEDDIKVPAFDLAINGGAQFRRLMFEVETFLRFSENGIAIRKSDVLQSCGIAMNSIGWREVVVKLLNNDAHLPLQKRVRYVAERIKYFFFKQKEPIVNFMKSLKGSPEEKLYSYLYSKHV